MSRHLSAARPIRLSEEDDALLDATCVALGSPAAPAPRTQVIRTAVRVFAGLMETRPDLCTGVDGADAEAQRALGARLARGAK